ncbi:MAG: mechanosensitive ion channel domain-containing protein [Cyanobacteria bacterium J06592_8]
MNTLPEIPSWLNFSPEMREFWIQFGIQLGLFTISVLVALILGKFLPVLIKSIVERFFPEVVVKVYQNLTGNLENPLRVTVTLLLFYVALDFLKEYQGLYRYLKLGVDLVLTFSIGFFLSGLFRNFLRIYGVNLIRKIGLEIDEILSIIETVFNIIIGILVALAFAQSQNINLVGVVAGLGIGGLSVAFAAQKTLEQLVGTLVVYLDRPYTVGEYIRIKLSSQGVLLGRVESIGVRSTKLRTLAKSTLVIVPNSVMANADIENVTRGKKIMVLLYVDFSRPLDRKEQAVLSRTVHQGTDSIFGIDPNSTSIKLLARENSQGVRAQISFCVLGSQDNSQEFRRQLMIVANESISKQLENYGLKFRIKEPTVYVESSITI